MQKFAREEGAIEAIQVRWIMAAAAAAAGSVALVLRLLLLLLLSCCIIPSVCATEGWHRWW